jgi:hypothetical protein
MLGMHRCTLAQHVGQVLGSMHQRHQIAQVQVARASLGRVEMAEHLVQEPFLLGR